MTVSCRMRAPNAAMRAAVVCKSRLVCRAVQSDVSTVTGNGAETQFVLENGYPWESIPLPALTSGGRAYSEHQRIRSHEVGPDRRSTLMTVSNILQEVASNHIVSLRGRSEEYFAADPELAKLNLIFVLTRMQIRMKAYPMWGDIVRAETYFNQEGRIGARRDWLLTNAVTGAEYGCATSSWVMLNTATRRLSKMPDEVAENYKKLMADPPRHSIPEAETKRKLPAFPEGPCLLERTHCAFRADMDMNNHVNNTAYISWLLETVPANVHDGGHLAQYEVDYKAECFAGNQMQIKSACAEEPVTFEGLQGDVSQYIHTVILDGETEVIRARTTWTL